MMAKKEKVNKSQAVRDYVKANREATNKVADALTKKGIKVNPNYVATLKSQAKRKQRARKAAATPVASAPATPALAPVAPEAPAKPSNAVTLEQIKMVGQMVKTIGGFRHLHDMLGIIKEVGGLKKFKDLLDAMSATDKDAIPF
jgi:hypothetical protein